VSGTNDRTEKMTTAATANAVITRCVVTDRSSAMTPAPTRAPATVPTLNPAWNRGMIARPSLRSTIAPWTFIATSQAPFAKPKKNSPMTTQTTPYWKPTATALNAAPSRTAIAATVPREPNRETICPASTSDTIEPAAMASSTRPSRDGVRPSPSRICGIRVAQLAIEKPEPMKAA
jgi:hypothetical protein